MSIRNSNAVLNRALRSDQMDMSNPATYGGIAKKSIFFLLMTFIGIGLSWFLLINNSNLLINLLTISSIATLITGIISFISVRACKVTGSIYCIFEGLTIGTISIIVAQFYEGAVTAAILGTIATVCVVIFLFTSNIIKVNSGFIKFLLIFAISFLVGQLLFSLYCTLTGIEFGFGLQIALSLLSTFLATLYLFFDLENIRRIVEGSLPKEYEWYASFGLIYTILWLYIEILRIVLIVIDRRN